MERKTSELIIGAIHDLTEKKGSSSQEILKFIAQKYDVNPRKIQSNVFAAIERGLVHGLLTKNEGLYRLQDVVPKSSSKIIISDDQKVKTNESKTNNNLPEPKKSDAGPLAEPQPFAKPRKPRPKRKRALPVKKRGAAKKGVRKARNFPKNKKKKKPTGRQAAALKRKKLNQRKRKVTIRKVPARKVPARSVQKKKKPKKEEKPKKDDFWPDWKFFRNMKNEDKKDKDKDKEKEEKEREEKNKRKGVKQRQRRRF